MLSTILLASLERSLNTALQQNPASQSRLAALAGSRIGIHCTLPELRLEILVTGQRLHLASTWDETPEAILQGSAPGLLHQLLARDPCRPQDVAESSVPEITGDRQKAGELLTLLQSLQPDWAYSLQRRVGPLASGLLDSQLSQGLQWSSASFAHLQRMLADYLNEETRSLVSQNEARARFRPLGDLQARLDQLEARLDRLAPPPTPTLPDSE